MGLQWMEPNQEKHEPTSRPAQVRGMHQAVMMPQRSEENDLLQTSVPPNTHKSSTQREDGAKTLTQPRTRHAF